MQKTTLIPLLMLTVSGCASFELGHDIDTSYFEQHVKRNETTQGEVLKWLGTPTSKGTVMDNTGKKYGRWVYYYGKGKLNKLSKTDIKTLEVQFEKDGTVSSYNWSASEKQTDTAK